MEAADADGDAQPAEGCGQVERAGKLVRLHADQHDHPAARLADFAGELFGPDALVGLVDRDDLERNVGAKRMPFGAIGGEAVEAGERVRRDRRAQPLDDVAVVVVVRRLDEDQTETGLGRRRRQHPQFFSITIRDAPGRVYPMCI